MPNEDQHKKITRKIRKTLCLRKNEAISGPAGAHAPVTHCITIITATYTEDHPMPEQTQETAPSESFLKDVEKAFDALEKAGQKVTVSAIRDATRGSMTKVCPAVRIVRERRKTRHREAETVPDMPEEVREAFEAAWVQTYRVADGDAAAARKSYAEKIAAKNGEIEEREAVILDLEAEKESLATELKAAKEAEYEARLVAARLEGVVGQYERDLQVANGRLEERDIILRAFVPSSK